MSCLMMPNGFLYCYQTSWFEILAICRFFPYFASRYPSQWINRDRIASK